MNPVSTYKTTSSLSWTRVDMLLLIYEKLVTSLQDGMRRIERQQTDQLSEVRFEVHRCLVTLVEGLNPDVDQIPGQIMRLSLFVMDQIQADSLSGWSAACKVMQTLREGFEEIQSEAREAEYTGKIPPVENLAG